MKWYEKQYPIGRVIKSYPSPAGNFPATITGYKIDHNLNTGERRPMIRVKVEGESDGKQFASLEEFDPSLLDV